MLFSDWTHVAFLLAASFGAGAINSVVGSGSLLTFPTLLALGVPPIPANIANNAGLAIGNMAGIWGYRRELRGQWRRIIPMIVATAIGALGGALLLLMLPPGVFSVVAPVLIVVGCALVVLQPLFTRLAARRTAFAVTAPTPSHNTADAPHISSWRKHTATLVTFLTGAYGGYFGAAQGVIIVGALGVLLPDPLQRINAVKNVLQTVAGWCATLLFVFITDIEWSLVIVIAAASLLGAQFGAVVGRKIPSWVLRLCIVVVGASAVYFFVV